MAPRPGPQPQEALVDERFRSEMRVTPLWTGLACQELGRGVKAVGFRGRIAHRKIMQCQGANLHTGFVYLPLRMAWPETARPLSGLNGVVHGLRCGVQEPHERSTSRIWNILLLRVGSARAYSRFEAWRNFGRDALQARLPLCRATPHERVVPSPHTPPDRVSQHSSGRVGNHRYRKSPESLQTSSRASWRLRHCVPYILDMSAPSTLGHSCWQSQGCSECCNQLAER